MLEQDQKILLNLLLKLTAKEDSISEIQSLEKDLTWLEALGLKALAQPWELLCWPADEKQKTILTQQLLDPYRPYHLKEEDRLLSGIQALIHQLDKALSLINKENISSLDKEERKKQLMAVKQLFQTYLKDLCCGSPEKRRLLLQPQPSILLPGQGWYYLSHKLDPHLGKPISDAVFTNRLPMGTNGGTSSVSHCGGIHFKFSPKKPSVEYAVHSLDKNLFAEAITNPSVMIKLKGPFIASQPTETSASTPATFVTYDVLATQTVIGKSLLRQQLTAGFFSSGLKLPAANFSQQFILQLLTLPGDGKLDNFIVTPDGKVIGIDNEMAFEPLVMQREGKGDHVSYVFTFLFLLEQMKEKLHADVRAQIANLPVEIVLARWLKQLSYRNKLYATCFKQGTLSPYLLADFKPGTIKRLYARLKALKELIKQDVDQRLTHWDMLKLVEPLLYAYYFVFNETMQGESLTQKLHYLHKAKARDKEALTYEALGLSYLLLGAAISKEADLVRNAPLRLRSADHRGIALAIEELLVEIDFVTYTAKVTEEQLDELFLAIGEIERCTLNACANLRDRHLLKLANNAPRLNYLEVSSPHQLTLKGLQEFLIQVDSNIHLCLGVGARLHLPDWHDMMSNPLFKRVSLMLTATKRLQIKPIEEEAAADYLYTLALATAFGNATLKQRANLAEFEQFLIEQNFALVSFKALVADKLPASIDASEKAQWEKSTLYYLSKTLRYKKTSITAYLHFYRQLPKLLRKLFYDYSLQEIVDEQERSALKTILGCYPDADGERRQDQEEKKGWQNTLRAFVDMTEPRIGTMPIVYLASPTLNKTYLRPAVVEALHKKGLIFSRQQSLTHESHFNWEKKKKSKQENKEIIWEKKEVERKETQPAMTLEVENSEKHGNHLVISLSYQPSSYQLHVKVMPDFPGMEMAFSLLARRLIGSHVPFVELWRWDAERYHYPVLISQTINGDNLTEDLLTHPLERKSYSLLVLLAFLTNPGDNNPGNFIAQKITTQQGETVLRLISIDNDRLFAPPFAAGQLRVATILYCFNEMLMPIDPEAREEFLEIDAYQLLKAWLDELEPLNQIYLNLFANELGIYLKEGINNQQSYLLTMLKRHTVKELFTKIKVMQDWLMQCPQMSLLDLLAKLHPSLANHYQHVLLKNISPILRFEQAVGNEFRREQVGSEKRYTSTMHMAQYLKMQGRELTTEKEIKEQWQHDLKQAKNELSDLSNSNEVIELAKRQLLKGQNKGFGELPQAYGQEEVLARIDWNRDVITPQGVPDVEKQAQFMEALLKLKELKSLKRLILINCEGLTDIHLTALLKRLPALKILKITGAIQLSKSLASLKLPLLEELIIENLPKLTVFHLTHSQVRYVAIKKVTQLKTLSLHSSSLKQLNLGGCQSLGEFNIHCPLLQKTDLSQCVALTDLQLQKFAVNHPEIEQLNLSGCSESKIMYLPIKQKIPAFAAVSLTGEPLHALAGLLMDLMMGRVKKLDLMSKEDMRAFVCKALCQALAMNTSVEEVDFSFTGIGDREMTWVANVLEKNQTVTSLNLRLNNIGAKGAKILAKALEKNQRVTLLDLESNDIGDGGAEALASMLKTNQNLIVLDLQQNKIGKQGLKALMAVVVNNKTIKQISLGSNFYQPLAIENEKKSKIAFETDEILSRWLLPIVKGVAPLIREKLDYSPKTTLPEITVNNPHFFFSAAIDQENPFRSNPTQNLPLRRVLEKFLADWSNNWPETFAESSLQLAIVASKFGFVCVDVERDGNCFFHAVADQLAQIAKVYTPEALRFLAIDYLLDHRADYENFIEGKSFHHLIAKMANPGTWADHLIIDALAHALNVAIAIINSDNSVPVFLKPQTAKTVIYLGYEVNKHYQSLHPDPTLLAKQDISLYLAAAPVTRRSSLRGLSF